MKLYLILLAGVAAPLFPGAVQAQVPLSAFRCQPLTEWNMRECCNAPNWREIIAPESQGICTRGVDRSFDEDDDAVGSITPPDDNDDGNDNTPPGDDDDDNGNGNGPPTQSGLGNPGNHKDVGKAGEKNMANEGVAPSHSDYGTKGNSDGKAPGNPSGNKNQ